MNSFLDEKDFRKGLIIAALLSFHPYLPVRGLVRQGYYKCILHACQVKNDVKYHFFMI